ncbi:MAG TPA: GNAT family N-acetyltransferase [Candidatus Didemnitutus sp.]|nr:GNAT family N-acetyltransferase [Candidatus Didemnitutus sp.]
MTPVLETPRLFLRPITAADSAFILELMNEPPYLENIGDRGVRSVVDAARYIEEKFVAAYARHGFGLYLVVTKADMIPIGICGLLKRDVLDHPDLGYAYQQRHWSQGHGTEAARATVELAQKTFALPYLHGVVAPTNARSIRLLERLGMKYLRIIALPGNPQESALYGMNLRHD